MQPQRGAARELRARDGECGRAGRLRRGGGRGGAGQGAGVSLPAGSAACAASDWAGASGAAGWGWGVGCAPVVGGCTRGAAGGRARHPCS